MEISKVERKSRWVSILGDAAPPSAEAPVHAVRLRERQLTAAEFHFRRGEHDEAIRCFEEALRVAPNDDHLLNRLGDCHERAGRVSVAHHYWERAADLLVHGGFVRKATALLRKILRHDPSRLDIEGRIAEIEAADRLASATKPALPRAKDPPRGECLSLGDETACRIPEPGLRAIDLAPGVAVFDDHGTKLGELRRAFFDPSDGRLVYAEIADRKSRVASSGSMFLPWRSLDTNKNGEPWVTLSPPDRSVLPLDRSSAVASESPGEPAEDAILFLGG